MKSVRELQTLSKQDLLEYFKKCTYKEIDQMLLDLGFTTQKMSYKSIINFAATQISQLGIFERITKH